MDIKEFIRSRNFALIATTLAGFTFIVGLHFGYVVKFLPPGPPSLMAGLAAEAVLESFFFGLGVAFLFIYGYALFKLERSPLKTRCIAIWTAMTYFFLSWYPHGIIHQFLRPTDPKNYVVLEMGFHWPGCAASLVLCFYQFDVLLISYSMAKMKKQLRGWTDADELIPPFYADFRYQAVALGLVGTAGWLIFSIFVNPAPPFGPSWLKGIWAVIWCVDSVAAGSSFSFAWAAYNIIPRLPNLLTRRIATICTVCIVWITIIIVPHPVSHIRATPTVSHVLALEFCWHGSMFIATGILAFYQYRFLDLAASGRLGMMMSMRTAKGTASTELHTRSRSSTDDSHMHPSRPESTIAVSSSSVGVANSTDVLVVEQV
eukprot:TRINITY_DN3224_c0_g1_i2.p1 TRINITY_DN3224_c0_g1~~TRINITY_DN3224_c0_g1_i2.p1  ORF type:complete len:373 (+),score=75.15 TRINITY_DN3224_c0_g1_i2:131-1249(+)